MRAILFTSCLVDQLFPEVGFAALRVLRAAGVEVLYDGRIVCCGQPAYNSGHHKEARGVALALLEATDQDLPLVSLSGSCAAMIKVFLPELAADGVVGSADSLSERTWEFSDFLANRLGLTSLDAPFEGVVAYHDSCHALRELGIQAPPRRLLEAVSGVEVRELDDGRRCCGFGGLFSTSYPEVSAAIGRDKVEAIRRSGADWVVSTDVSCLMQIDGLLRREGLSVRTAHLAQVLDPEGAVR